MINKKKEIWKSNLENFFHDYFIGISHLKCTNKNCPIVDNWDEIEEKNSKKGLCALYKISPGNFLVVDATVGNDTDAGTYENIEITLPSKATCCTKSTVSKKVLISGSNVQVKEQLPFLKDNEYVLFVNNKARHPNLNGIDDYLEDMWDIKDQIAWDREASKKKIINWVEQKPDPDDKSKKIEEFKGDHIYYIHNPNITNEIKKHEVFQTQNTKEREQLHIDYEKLFSEIRRVFGIRHLTSKKEERQDNPEIELNEAQFIALERRKKRIREKCLKEAVNKGFYDGEHIIIYGVTPEKREVEEQIEDEAEETKE